MKKQALVTRVQIPAVVHSSGQYQVTVAYMTKPYSFQGDDGEIVKVAGKKRKRDVFTNFLPKIGQFIEVSFL